MQYGNTVPLEGAYIPGPPFYTLIPGEDIKKRPVIALDYITQRGLIHNKYNPFIYRLPALKLPSPGSTFIHRDKGWKIG
jgi:hypothetical protein